VHTHCTSACLLLRNADSCASIDFVGKCIVCGLVTVPISQKGDRSGLKFIDDQFIRLLAPNNLTVFFFESAEIDECRQPSSDHVSRSQGIDDFLRSSLTNVQGASTRKRKGSDVLELHWGDDKIQKVELESVCLAPGDCSRPAACKHQLCELHCTQHPRKSRANDAGPGQAFVVPALTPLQASNASRAEFVFMQDDNELLNIAAPSLSSDAACFYVGSHRPPLVLKDEQTDKYLIAAADSISLRRSRCVQFEPASHWLWLPATPASSANVCSGCRWFDLLSLTEMGACGGDVKAIPVRSSCGA
jgi:hypothetical protein